MATQNGDQLRFTRLHLENWRNFSRVDAELQSRVFLVGPNAAGKSNLLDVFRFLHDLVAVGGGLQAAVEQQPRRGISNLRSLAARNPSDIVIHVVVGTTAAPRQWEYELRLSHDKRYGAVITQERVVRPGGAQVFSRPKRADARDPDTLDPKRLTQTYLEQVSANLEFRELAEFFGSVRYLHLVPQLVREPDRSVGHKDDPFGGDFLEQVARTTEKTRRGRLGRIKKALKVAVPQLQDLVMWRDVRGTPHLRGKYAHWRPQGAWQTEDHLSDGTLRLLGLLWAALDGVGPLLLEEPELSLHPEVVRFLPQMFARMTRRTGRQILLSSHSSDLLRDTGIGLDEVLVLQPDKEGTVVKRGSDFAQVEALLRGGSSLADAVLPLTRPELAEQLTMFAE
jgi:predicted ATPase